MERSWNDLQPGDTVIELDGHEAVFVIAKESDLRNHWDVVVLSSNHPRNGELTAYRRHWLRRCGHPGGSGPIPMSPNHRVIRGGEVLFET